MTAISQTTPTRLRSTHDATFDHDVASAPLVLVKFTGAWCPPCRALQPTLEALARDRPDVLVLSLDIDDNRHVSQRYGVRSVPTLIAFRDGKPAGQLVGNQGRHKIDALISVRDGESASEASSMARICVRNGESASEASARPVHPSKATAQDEHIRNARE